MRKPWILIAAALVTLSAAGALDLHEDRITSGTEQIERDWDALCKAMTSLGLDYCGYLLPSDTSWRSQERPTFETFRTTNPYARTTMGGIRRTQLLTTPFAYVSQYPEDPFNPGEGYGYVSWSYYENEPAAGLLHSPGPDGDIDLRIERLFMIVDAPPRFEEPPDRGSRRLGEVMLPRFRALEARFAYDPTNGLRSDGDVLRFYYQFPRITEMYGSPVAADEEIAALLQEFSADVVIPIPRWENEASRNAEFTLDRLTIAVSETSYKHFQTYLDAGENASGDPLETLRNHLEPFASVFDKGGPLTEEQSAALAQWKADNPQWWDLIENAPPNTTASPFAYLDVAPFAEFYVLYGKSRILEGERLLAADELHKAFHLAYWLANPGYPRLDDPEYVSVPLAERAGREIRRMGKALKQRVIARGEAKGMSEKDLSRRPREP